MAILVSSSSNYNHINVVVKGKQPNTNNLLNQNNKSTSIRQIFYGEKDDVYCLSARRSLPITRRKQLEERGYYKIA